MYLRPTIALALCATAALAACGSSGGSSSSSSAGSTSALGPKTPAALLACLQSSDLKASFVPRGQFVNIASRQEIDVSLGKTGGPVGRLDDAFIDFFSNPGFAAKVFADDEKAHLSTVTNGTIEGHYPAKTSGVDATSIDDCVSA